MIRKALLIAWIQLRLWRRSARVGFVLALGFVLAGLLTGKAMAFTKISEAPVISALRRLPWKPELSM